MKTFNALLAAVCSILFFASCQKGIDDLTTSTPGSPTSTSRPKTYSESIYYAGGGHDSVTFNLSYDANSRLLSMISTSNPGDKFIYQYSGNKITMELFNSNLLSIHQESYLNSFSFIDSTYQYNDTQDTSSEKYLYNSSKQLTTLKEYDKTSSGYVLSDTHTYLYDANGDVIKDSDNFFVYSYEYSAIANTFSMGFDYLPNSKHLVSKTISTSGGITVTYTHTYTIDSSNRLTSERIVSSDGDILIKSYTY
jgi:hypothetical protein